MVIELDNDGTKNIMIGNGSCIGCSSAFGQGGNGGGRYIILGCDDNIVSKDVVETNIVICTKCNGEGHKNERVSANSSEKVSCTTCNGKGRLRRVIIQELKTLED